MARRDEPRLLGRRAIVRSTHLTLLGISWQQSSALSPTQPSEQLSIALSEALTLVPQVKEFLIELPDPLSVRDIVDDDVVVLLRDAQ